MLKEEVQDLKGSLKKMKEEIKQQSLALEMMKELKKSAHRWFIISIVLLIALIGTNIAWLIYESQFETVYQEETDQTIDDIDNSSNNNFIQQIN